MFTIPLQKIRNLCAISLCLLVIPLGCSDKKKSSEEIIALEGKIEKIDAKPDGTGKITVIFRDKKNIEMPGVGEVTSETEILINGAVAKLSDLKVGERVRGQVKVIKENNERKQIALKISAERTELTKPAETPTDGK